MIRTIFVGLAVVGLMFGPSVAAQAAEGWYISANAGVSMLSDADSPSSGTFGEFSYTSTNKVDFDDGSVVTGAIGYAWKNVRFESELSYRTNDTISTTGSSATPSLGFLENYNDVIVDGEISSLGFMANGYYDLDTGSSWKPFVMAGVGGAKLDFGFTTYNNNGPLVFGKSSDTVFAYQVGAGIGYAVSKAVTVNLSYRFFGTADPTFDDGVAIVGTEYKTYNIMLGLTYNL